MRDGTALLWQVAVLSCVGCSGSSKPVETAPVAPLPAEGALPDGVLETPRTFANPLDLDYRFTLDAPSRREAADPTVVRYRDAYYLFASKSGGYWTSRDLGSFSFVPAPTLPTEDYAPTAVVLDEWLYFMASSSAPSRIYRSQAPERGTWELYNDAFPLDQTDPALFVDDDGRVYLYYGCSDREPLRVVELDPENKLNPKGPALDLFGADPARRGWERRGDRNERAEPPWVEGAWMTKHGGKYYLQYSAPGTEFKSYADGVHIGPSPFGPFEPARDNPFSAKPGGFIGGAGHGSTFSDAHGNFWHIATMSISVKHMFERRLGLFPAAFDVHGDLHSDTRFGDYPTLLPESKVDDIQRLFSGNMLLSYEKAVSSSSAQPGLGPERAVDEDVRSYFSAATGNPGEWLSVDLGRACSVRAVQLNFAEHEPSAHGRENLRGAAYFVEHSLDGSRWGMLADRRQNEADRPHAYFELEPALSARHLRVTSERVPSGTFAVSGLRVFGRCGDKPPAAVSELKVERNGKDRCRASLRWKKSDGATGYSVRWGADPARLYHSELVYTDEALELGSLEAEKRYWFSVDAFNESGLTAAAKSVEAP